MSCNGCRVLRKGCSESCVLRQCLKGIESVEAQGHATIFVAKFFGRAGMMSLISSVPESQRPAIFQSLLYEACGRTINPVFGAVGLLCSGNWSLCEEAVETVMNGGFIHSTPDSASKQWGFGSKVRLGRGYIQAPFLQASRKREYQEAEEEVTDEQKRCKRGKDEQHSVDGSVCDEKKISLDLTLGRHKSPRGRSGSSPCISEADSDTTTNLSISGRYSPTRLRRQATDTFAPVTAAAAPVGVAAAAAANAAAASTTDDTISLGLLHHY